MSLVPGILVASAAALALNCSYLVQHAGLSSAPLVRASRPLATVRALLRSRTWLVGALLGYGGLILNTVALALAPLSIVQSVVAAGLVVVALGVARVRRRRPSARELAAIGLIAVALAGLGIGAGPAAAHPPSTIVLLAFDALAALAAWAIVGRRRGARAAHRLGLAAGVLYGATNVALAALLASGGAIDTVAVGVAGGAAVTAGGFFAFQRGLQCGPATGVVTLMSAGTNVVAILGGLLVLGETLGTTPAMAALHAGSFVLIVLAGVLAANELSRLGALPVVPGTTTPRAPSRSCSAVPGRAGQLPATGACRPAP